MTEKQKPFMTFENAPNPKKKPIQQPFRKLNLVYKAKTKPCGYRFRVETIEALNDLTEKLNTKVNIKLSMTNILELLIIDASRNPKKVLELIEGK